MSINGESRATCEKAACSLHYSYCHCSVGNACVFESIMPCMGYQRHGLGAGEGVLGAQAPPWLWGGPCEMPKFEVFPSWLCGGPHEMPNFELCALPVA